MPTCHSLHTCGDSQTMARVKTRGRRSSARSGPRGLPPPPLPAARDATSSSDSASRSMSSKLHRETRGLAQDSGEWTACNRPIDGQEHRHQLLRLHLPQHVLEAAHWGRQRHRSAADTVNACIARGQLLRLRHG